MRDRYMAYPLSVSPIFRLEDNGRSPSPVQQQRAYLYRMNTSPGLLAGDSLAMSIRLDAGSSLYLADQAATKVHTMPVAGIDKATSASVRYHIEVGEAATLEFLPEPLILFGESALKQTTEITLYPTAGLCWGEIILPGRLSRAEHYQFRECFSRIQLATPDGRICFVEAMKLLGKENRFAQSALFASAPVLGSLILVLPEAGTMADALARLSHRIEALATDSLSLACTVLPGERGLFVRAIAATTRAMQAGFKGAVDEVRSLRNQAPLPYSL
ncbi:MAG: urease accessory protein UreD [Cyanobacteria bacterium J06623_4]